MRNKLEKLALEIQTSLHKTPEDRIKTAFESLELALKIRQSSNNLKDQEK